MRIVFLMITLFFSVSISVADSTQMREEIRSLLNEQKYERAEEKSAEFLEQEESDGVRVLFLESVLQQEEYASFDSLSEDFISAHKDSEYLPRVYYLQGIGLAKRGMYTEAFQAFNDAAALVEEDTRQMEILKENSERLLHRFISYDELRNLDRQDLAQPLRELYDYYYAVHLKSHDLRRAQRALREFMDIYPNTEYDTSRVIGSLAPDPDKRAETDQHIALVLPLTGGDSLLGIHAQQAAEMALNEFSQRTGSNLDIDVIDNNSSSVGTAEAVADLIDADVDIIIGPLMSDPATVAAAMLIDRTDILLITPTATDGGIAALGENVFQLNITPEVIARRIARYAMENLSIREFAVLSELTEYGRLVTEYFVEEVESLGGTILYSDFFPASASDHGENFREMKRYFARQNMDIDTADTLTSRQRDQVESFVEDSTLAIPGLFMPSAVSSAVNLAAQVPFYKIRTQMLGTNSWDNNNLILDGGDYVRDMIFSTDYSLTQDRDRWDDFSQKYKENYAMDPQRQVVPLAYDAVHIVLEGLQRSGGTDAMRRYITNLSAYDGLSGLVTIESRSGRNKAVMIKRVDDREFIRMD
ncbi:MAG: ABC transporter substrate-binding protein [Fibrobacterota bacterium]